MKGLIVIFIIFHSILYSSIANASNTNKTETTSHTTASINSDIKALSEKVEVAQQAANRLAALDESVLHQLHAALNNNDYQLRHKTIIAHVIGSFEDKSSIRPLILLATSNPDDADINSAIIRILTIFPRSDEIDNFIYSKLNDNATPERNLQYSLKLLAKHPANKDKKWAEKYSGNDYDLATRSLAMYLGGILKIDSFKEKIINTLLHRNKKTGEEYMLIGLSYLTMPDEFDTIAKTDGIRLDSDNIKLAKYHYYFKNGTKEEKREAASIIIHSDIRLLKREAIQYFIQTDDAEGLAHSWLNNDNYVKQMLNRAGLSINIGDDKTSFIKQKDKNNTIAEANNMTEPDASKAEHDTLARAIFSSLQKNKKDKFETTALASKRQINKYIATMAPSHAYKLDVLSKYKDQLNKDRESILASWDVIYAKGIENNIDWPSAKYVASSGYNYPSKGIESLITYKGYYYSILAHEVTKYDNDLRLSSSLSWNTSTWESREYQKWISLAKNNNDLTSSHELELLSNTRNEGKIPILRMRAEYGNISDQYSLYRKLEPSSNENDKREALKWLKIAADRSYPIAQYQLSQHLMSDWYKSQAVEKLHEARSYLLKAAEQNNIFALKDIAEHYSIGSADFDLDLSKAIEYYQRLLQLGSTSLSKEDRNTYIFFEQGVVDNISTLQTHKKALEDNDPATLTDYALLQLNNTTIKSKTNGLAMLKHAVDLNYPDAQYQLGKIYVTGNEVINKNITTAIELWTKASTQDHIKATTDLAYGYINSDHGINKNPEKALILADKLVDYYRVAEADYKFSDSIIIWRVHACDLEFEIKRANDPSFVIPRVKTGRCAGL